MLNLPFTLFSWEKTPIDRWWSWPIDFCPPMPFWFWRRKSGQKGSPAGWREGTKKNQGHQLLFRCSFVFQDRPEIIQTCITRTHSRQDECLYSCRCSIVSYQFVGVNIGRLAVHLFGIFVVDFSLEISKVLWKRVSYYCWDYFLSNQHGQVATVSGTFTNFLTEKHTVNIPIHLQSSTFAICLFGVGFNHHPQKLTDRDCATG